MSAEQRGLRAALREVLENISVYHEAMRSAVDRKVRTQLEEQLGKLHERRVYIQCQLGGRPRIEPRKDRRGLHKGGLAWR